MLDIGDEIETDETINIPVFNTVNSNYQQMIKGKDLLIEKMNMPELIQKKGPPQRKWGGANLRRSKILSKVAV
jgi:hypothetical protein